jgi:hypothetical protein
MQATKQLAAEAKTLGERAEIVLRERTKFAHCLFGRIIGRWYLLRTTGARTIDSEKVQRVELPQMQAADAKAIGIIRREARANRRGRPTP